MTSPSDVMKNKIFYITSLQVLSNCMDAIVKIVPNGSIKVTISSAGSKSSKQRGLDWIWNTDISKSGIGGKYEDTKEGVHLVSKWRFAIPIFQRDDSFFSDLYDAWVNKYGEDTDRMFYFIDQHVSTERFNVSQMAEYLTAKQQYYSAKGVQLTDPEFQGLLDK